jgi:hypothetical protein
MFFTARLFSPELTFFRSDTSQFTMISMGVVTRTEPSPIPTTIV